MASLGKSRNQLWVTHRFDLGRPGLDPIGLSLRSSQKRPSWPFFDAATKPCVICYALGMKKFTIYHNPRCSKSRETLALLEQNGIKPTIIEYLKDPLNESELLGLMETLDPASMVRSKDDKYLELRFKLDDKKTVAKELARHPELLERPIVVKGKKAVIGRPPENVKKLF
jgi:arsenate reductase